MSNFTIVRLLNIAVIYAALGSFYLSPSASMAEEKQPDVDAKELPMSPEVIKRIENLKTAGKQDLAAKLSEKIRKAWETTRRFSNGHVIVGQVKLADAKKDVRLVDAQMVILEEGLFAGEVKDLERPVGFALQGYLPVELQLRGKSGEIVDVGEIILQPLTQKDSAGVSAKVLLESGSPTNAKIRLRVNRGAINTPHNGYSPRGSPGWEAPKELISNAGGEFYGSNLSPGKYHVTISAPGHVNQSRTIDLMSGKDLNLGEIRLLAELAGEKKPVDFWEADYSAALQKSKKENKPLFVMLTTEQCGWCKKLEEDTLSHSKIQSFLEPFVKVQVYADKNEGQGNLARKLGAAGYPTLVFLDQNESVLNRWFGYKEPTSFAIECAKAYEAAKIPLPEDLKKLVEKVKMNSE